MIDIQRKFKYKFFFILIIAVLIFLFYFFFNLNYLTTFIDEKGDCITYDYYVRLGLPQFLYNPHHIWFDALGLKMLNFVKEKGYKDSSMIILQLRNLLISSIGLSLFFVLFYQFSKKILLSLLVTFLIAFTCGYWIYTQINDTPLIHSVLLMVLFLVLLLFENIKRKSLFAVFLGLLHSITIFFHQSDVIFGFVIVIYILFSKSEKKVDNDKELNKMIIQKPKMTINLKSNIKYILFYTITSIIIVSSAYYYTGVVKIGLTLDINKAQDFNKIKNSTYFFNWLILYAKIDYWGKGYKKGNTFTKSIYGITTYFYQPTTYNNKSVTYDLDDIGETRNILPNMLLILFIFPLIFFIFNFKRLLLFYNNKIISLIVFILIYTAFSGWWEPDYREFWVATLMSYWLFILFIYNYIIDKTHYFKMVVKLLIYNLMLVTILLLFITNFTGFLYQYSNKKMQKFDIIQNIDSSKLKSHPITEIK